MSGLMDLIGQHLDESALEAISQRSGAPRARVEAAIPAALATLTSGLSNNAQAGGASSLLSALDRDHDGSILDDLPGLLGGMSDSHGDGILGHVLGGRRPVAEQAVSRASGLDAGSAGQILAMLAPVLMGALGKQRRERGLGEMDITDLLGGERRRVESDSQLSGLARVLDADGDGSVMDEITEIGGSLLGGLFGGRR